MTRAVPGIAALLVLCWGCILQSPRYEGTEFTCEEPTAMCPEGYQCVDGVCRADEPDGTTDPSPDAGVTDPPTPDAAVSDDPSADASPRPDVTVTLSGTDITFDTYLRHDTPDDNYGHQGDVAIDADPVKVGLLRFDLSSIPQTSEVISAEMVLHFSDPIEDGEFLVYQMLESWSENEATWNQRRNGVPWTSPGAGTGSHVPTPMFTLVAREVKAYTIALPASVVQQWVSAPLTNHGMKWDSGSTQGRGGEFDSAEETTPTTDAPIVRVRYR